MEHKDGENTRSNKKRQISVRRRLLIQERQKIARER
jgi:hypothetical protein